MAATVARANDGLRRTNRLPSKARLTTIMLPTMRTMKTLDAPGLLLLPLGQRRIDDKRAKPLAARVVMKSSKKEDSTTKMTKSTMSTMSMTTLPRNFGAADDGDGGTKTMVVCAARTDFPRRPG